MSFLNKIKLRIFPSYKPTETEELVIDIINLLFGDEKTECITAPISNKYYITNKKLNYYIKVDISTIVITNHKFSYVVQSPLPFYEIICDIIREYIEKDRAEFEKTVFQNEVELLTNIKTNIKYHGNN